MASLVWFSCQSFHSHFPLQLDFSNRKAQHVLLFLADLAVNLGGPMCLWPECVPDLGGLYPEWAPDLRTAPDLGSGYCPCQADSSGHLHWVRGAAVVNYLTTTDAPFGESHCQSIRAWTQFTARPPSLPDASNASQIHLGFDIEVNLPTAWATRWEGHINMSTARVTPLWATVDQVEGRRPWQDDSEMVAGGRHPCALKPSLPT